MVEESRLAGKGMPCGRVMLATIFRHFQLEKDRIGMLGERNLLTLRLKGNKVEDLINFQEKYRYIMAAIPVDDLPGKLHCLIISLMNSSSSHLWLTK